MIFYTIFVLLFTIIFLLDENNKINFGFITNTNHTDKKVFFHELSVRLCFLFLFISILINFWLKGVYYNNLTTIFMLLSIVLFFISKKTMKDNWATNITNNQEKLSDTGVFKFSRNPVYIAYHLLFISCIFLNPFVFVPIYIIYALSVHFLILQEEKYLRIKFGNDYDVYCLKVRRYF